jgi:DNA-directed RNA polymerase subunit M/transcription elongation factor TFIIS
MGLWLKSCPKCGGDLYSDRDVMGYYRQCLQCGYTFYEQRRREERTLVEVPASGPGPEGEESEAAAEPKGRLHAAA